MAFAPSIAQQHAVKDATPYWPHKPKGADQPHEIQGLCIHKGDWDSAYSEVPDTQYVLMADDGEVWSVVTHGTRLRDEFAEKAPAPGDTVSVRFLGMKQPQEADRRAYPDYSVAVERAKPLPADVAEDEVRDQAQRDDVEVHGDDDVPF